MLRDGAAGLFMAASQFPKHRETRAPFVHELLPHRDAIDPKYHFLLEAPQKDPDGNLALVRFSRKTSQQYVQTEVAGKPTGWRAFYTHGQWIVGKGDDDESSPTSRRTAKKAPVAKASTLKSTVKKAAAKKTVTSKKSV